MSERGSHGAQWDAETLVSLLTLGVMWSPVTAKHRRIPPKLLTPGNRRSGRSLRRSWPRGQHVALCGG